MTNIQKKYKEEIMSKLQEKLDIKNSMAIPKLSKIVVNMGVKDALSDKKNIERARSVLSQITGQKPKTTKAKKSIASFKLREGDEIGMTVTLRGKRMNDFFEKLIYVVLPRLKDFHGLRKTSFDKRGNYTLGFSEFSVFPEIDLGKIDKIQGLEISVITTAQNDQEGQTLLEMLGMPFEKGK